jgi:hypothetical protein
MGGFLTTLKCTSEESAADETPQPERVAELLRDLKLPPEDFDLYLNPNANELERLKNLVRSMPESKNLSLKHT